MGQTALKLEKRGQKWEQIKYHTIGKCESDETKKTPSEQWTSAGNTLD